MFGLENDYSMSNCSTAITHLLKRMQLHSGICLHFSFVKRKTSIPIWKNDKEDREDPKVNISCQFQAQKRNFLDLERMC